MMRHVTQRSRSAGFMVIVLFFGVTAVASDLPSVADLMTANPYLELEVDVSGVTGHEGPGNQSARIDGAAGGNVLIRTGADVNVGDGRDGVVQDDRELAPGEYWFRQVVPKNAEDDDALPVLTVSADLTIHCQLLFRARIRPLCDGNGKSPSVTIYAGQPIWLDPPMWTPPDPPAWIPPGAWESVLAKYRDMWPWAHRLVYEPLSDCTRTCDGGDVTVMTTARVGVVGNILASGSNGWAGGKGGNAGSVQIIVQDVIPQPIVGSMWAIFGSYSGRIVADGGDSSSGPAILDGETGSHGEDGGNGGMVAISGSGCLLYTSPSPRDS